MNPFLYSLAEKRKTVIAFVASALAVAGYFIVFPGQDFDQSVLVCLGALFNVIGVFATENASAEDYSKAVQAAAGSVLTLIGYFTTVNPDTVQTVIGLALAALNVFLVAKVGNAPIARRTAARRT